MIKAIINFNDGSVVPHSSDIKEIREDFKPGFYNATTINHQLVVNVQNVEELHRPYPNKDFIQIIGYIDKFFDPELKEKMNKMGFSHKLGVLLGGPAGTGKTSFIFYTANMLVKKKKAVVFVCDNMASVLTTIPLIKDVREIQDNPIVIIMDEFERWAARIEAEMKTFLDGCDSVDNMVTFASTNYLDHVPKSLSERPSRFKIVREILGIDSVSVIKGIIKDKSDIIKLFSDAEITKIANKLSKKNPTLDQIKSCIVDHVLGESVGLNSTMVIKPFTKKAKKGEKELEDERKEFDNFVTWMEEDFKVAKVGDNG